MKVVWLCPYSVTYLKDKIKLNTDDFSQIHPATWLFYLKEEFSKRIDIQLFIITITRYVDKDWVFKEGNITYYVLKPVHPIIPTLFVKLFFRLEIVIFRRFYFSEKKVANIIKEINPDIINIHGTENNYANISNRLTYPSVIYMQGVIHLVEKGKKNLIALSRLRVENKAFKKVKYFMTIPGNMESVILSHNKKAHFFKLDHPVSNYAFELKEKTFTKNSDLSFVGSIQKSKGVEDIICATSILINEYPEIKVKIIGFSGKEYLHTLQKIISDNKLEKNIHLLGFIQDHNLVLEEVKQSKIFVLPTYADSGPRSVAESMAMGIPVIAYNVDGLPILIENKFSGLLVEKGNISKLSAAIKDLLSNQKKGEYLAENAYQYALNNFYAPKITQQMVDIYKFIVN